MLSRRRRSTAAWEAAAASSSRRDVHHAEAGQGAGLMAGRRACARRAVTEAAQVPGKAESTTVHSARTSVVFERIAEVFLPAGTVMRGRPYQAHMLEVP